MKIERAEVDATELYAKGFQIGYETAINKCIEVAEGELQMYDRPVLYQPSKTILTKLRALRENV